MPELAPPGPPAQTPRAADGLLALGLETSCDDTAAAVLRWREGARPDVLGEARVSQDDAHAPYGGVVPEIAARAHADRVDAVMQSAMDRAGIAYADLDLIAGTAGPGLIGGVMVGLTAAKAVALAWDRPFLAVNHLEGHALSPLLSDDVAFAYVLLLVSGGHTQLLLVRDVGDYERLGSTIDDAAGEAFDKTAKLLGLPMPGGPALEALAQEGDPTAVALPRPLAKDKSCDFSFAGLKTAAARLVDALPAGDRMARADLAASFQATVARSLAERSARALARAPQATALVAAGGVAANQTVRQALSDVAKAAGLPMIAPPLKWCTDNAAMIALAGAERFARGERHGFDVAARPRWPLDETAALTRPATGSGKKGPKA